MSYRLHCPNCGKTLTTERRPAKARLRCPACEHVFVASTGGAGAHTPQSAGPAVPPQAPAPAPRDKHHAYHATAPQRVRSRWPLIAVPVGAGLLIGLVVAVVVAYRHRPQRPEPTPPPQAHHPPATRPAVLVRRTGQPDDDGVPPAPDPREPATRPARRPLRAVAEGTDLHTERVEVADLWLVRGGGRNAFALGHVRNGDGARTLEAVRIAVDVRDADGKLLASNAAQVRCVAPERSLGFSVKLPRLSAEVPLDSVTPTARIIAAPDWLGSEHVCIVVPDSRCDYEYEPRAVRLLLTARNSTPETLTDLRVCTDLYGPRRGGGRRHIAHHAMRDEGGRTVAPGDSFRMTASLPTLMPQLVSKVDVRIVARPVR